MDNLIFRKPLVSQNNATITTGDRPTSAPSTWVVIRDSLAWSAPSAASRSACAQASCPALTR
jgi:hypothetical protein